jgi:pantoate--beta-alanine ligase
VVGLVAVGLVAAGQAGESWGVLVLTTKAELRDHLDTVRHAGRTVGLVPTMGALHEGHLSLLSAAAGDCDVVVVTVFVNPLQFGAGEDLDAYPRPLDRDLELAEQAGADVAFTPSVAEMYPRPIATTVHVDGLTAHLEGASRPTHFDGVTTVVTKLFGIAGPCRAYFGEKDYQQVAVVTRMAADLDQPVTVVPRPTVREPDGLARSSRNVYLSAEQRAAAPVLHRALRAGIAMVAAGERDALAVAAQVADVIGSEPLARLDYAEVVDADTLEPFAALERDARVRLLVAANFGSTRLLDNLGTVVP